MKFSLLAFIILLLSTFSLATNHSVQLDNKVSLSWEIHGDEITMQLRFRKNNGWAGIGFHCSGCGYTGMADADYIIAQVTPTGEVKVGDYFSSPRESGYAAPLEDSKLNGMASLMSSSGYIDGRDLTFRFTRKLNTGDHRDHVIAPGDTSVIYAYSFGDVGGLSYHSSHQGVAVVNFFPEDEALGGPAGQEVL